MVIITISIIVLKEEQKRQERGAGGLCCLPLGRVQVHLYTCAQKCEEKSADSIQLGSPP